MATRADALVMMAKTPKPGRVKTRLVPPLSEAEATELYRCLLLDQIENLRAFGDAELFIAFTPDGAADFFTRLLLTGEGRFAQRGDDLGERMNHCFTELAAKGYRSIVLIGGDLPPVPLAVLAEAYRILRGPERRVVLGPSRDGGYYLVGMNGPVPELFRGLTWSSDRVFEETVAKLRGLDLSASILPPWFDIDTIDDIRYLASVFDELPENAGGYTRELLRKPEMNKWA